MRRMAENNGGKCSVTPVEAGHSGVMGAVIYVCLNFVDD